VTSLGAAVVLPARYHSTRFPGKPLAVIAGRPLIEWVYRRASEIRGVTRVLVATDHEHIATAVRDFGGDVVMTSPDHPTGTDRVAAVARTLENETIVNLQGDEPLFPPGLVEEMIAALTVADNDGPVDIVTACHRINRREEIDDPNIVKVVMDRSARALYFSRAPIPFAKSHQRVQTVHYRHIGVYVFRKESLIRFADALPTALERSENLEQLRALQNGMRIRVVETEYSTVGVDVPADIKSVEKALVTTYSL
jgi:3-deoxy-manno-octulosonate cytidylyltransferase (CMP-KDO synthetase)